MTRRFQLALVFVPVGLPLAVLAASPHRLLPHFPVYRYTALSGDAYGYYSCARELISLLDHDAPYVALAAIAAAMVVLLARRTRSALVIAGAVNLAAAGIAALFSGLVPFTGAPQIGWPLIWSVVLVPLRVVGRLDPDAAFAVGLPVSIACNVVTVFATYRLAVEAGLGLRVARFAAAAVSLWPLLSLLTGPQASANGTWQGWLGLSLYTEPISTMLVVVALVVVVREGSREAEVIVAGGLLGLATLVRGSNVVIVAVLLGALVLLREQRRALFLAVGAAPWAVSVLLFWPKGYPSLGPPTFPKHPFAVAYASRSWSQSYLWHPAVLLVLVPVALAAIPYAGRRASLLLWPSVLATGAFYTFYADTPLHPRFLFVVLPVVLILWGAGAAWLVGAVRQAGARAAVG